MKNTNLILAVGAMAAVCGAASADTTLDYSAASTVYSQNFNSLASSGSWSNNVSTPSVIGWNVYRGGTSANSTRDATTTAVTAWSGNTGSSNTGAFYAFASTSSSDRAIGGLSSNTTGDYCIVLSLKNTAGYTLTGFSFDWVLEQWRDGGNNPAVAQSIFVDYKVSTQATASSLSESVNYLTDASYVTGFSALVTATSPVVSNTGTGAALDGNASANRVAYSNTVTGLNWTAGSILVIRFWDNNHSGNDHAFGIDDVSFTAVPAPGALALLGVAGIVGGARRRR